jgi:hypothetical protein
MFSLKALWTECNPHKAPTPLSNCHSNSIHHAEANSISDVLAENQTHQGACRLQAFYLDQLEKLTAPSSIANANGSRLLALTKRIALSRAASTAA